MAVSVRYQAHLSRSGRWWAIDVPDLSIFTQSRTLEEAAAVACEAIAERLEVPVAAVAVDLVVAEAAGALHLVREARARSAAAAAEELEAVARAAQALVGELGMSYRDAAALLGVPYEHIARLVPTRA